MKSNLLRKTRGTNGHTAQYGNLRASVFLGGFLLCLLLVASLRGFRFTVNHTIVSAYVGSTDVYPTIAIPEPTVTPTPKQNQEVRDYIIEVFEEDAGKAFKLLACENSTLNPDAVNTYNNTPAGSRDIGVFQINEYWQKTQGKFLFNYKINVEIAHQLFEENGKTFKLWTCGKQLGI